MGQIRAAWPRVAIETALANSRDLRSALLRVQEARTAYAIQRSVSVPNVALQGAAERSRAPDSLKVKPAERLDVTNRFQLVVRPVQLRSTFWGAVRNRNEAALQDHQPDGLTRRSSLIFTGSLE